MVATILRLRWDTITHQLKRDWWRVVVLGFGVVWALSLLPSVAWIARGLAERQVDVRADAYTAIFALCGFGWVVVPVLIAGLDDSLDPARFAALGIGIRRIMPGLTASAFVSIPVVFFGISFTVFAESWILDGWRIAGVAFVGSLLAVAGFVFSARVSAMWMARMLQSRRSREFAFLGLIVVVLAGTPIASVFIVDGLESFLEYDIRPVLASLRNTPLGAPVGAAAAAQAGDWWGVSWRLAVSAAWVGALWLAWRVNVARVLVHPVFRGGGARAREDSILASAKAPRRWPFGRGASQTARAVRARAIRYWFSDPRYLAAIISVSVFPAVFFLLVYPAFGSPIGLVVAVPLLLAGTIGWGRHNDVAFDSTALWLDIVSGRLGRDVMRGRVSAALVWSAPLVLATAAASVGVIHRIDLAPGVVGASVGVLGTSLAVSAVTSVVLPYHAPAPGENPFSAEVGSLGAGLFAQIVSSGAAWIVAVPVVLPLVAAIVWNPWWGWVGLVTGVATGVGVLVAGVRTAGKIYDRRSGGLVGAVA